MKPRCPVPGWNFSSTWSQAHLLAGRPARRDQRPARVLDSEVAACRGRDGDAGVTEQLGHDLHRNPVTQPSGRRRVSHPMWVKIDARVAAEA